MIIGTRDLTPIDVASIIRALRYARYFVYIV